MHAFTSIRRRIFASLVAGLALGGCSDRRVDPITGIKSAPTSARAGLIANGNLNICKMAGPAGTYHFHIDVTGGGPFSLPDGPDNTVEFDGIDPSCWVGAYTNAGGTAWTGLTASITISEVLIPAGIVVDSIALADRGGNFEAHVTDGGTAITFNEGPLEIQTVKFYNGATPSVTCAAINAVAGIAITPVNLTASGGSGAPYTFSATGLPPGISISTSGTISGTPTTSGMFNYTVIVTDRDGHTGTVSCSVTVNGRPSTSCVVIDAVMGTAITPATFVGSGGAGAPYTFSAMGLPAGLTMSASGTISGTPTVGGIFNYTVTVTDKNGNTGTLNCSLTVTKQFGIGPSSMEGHLTILPGTWFNGGHSFKFVNGSHAATQFAVAASVKITVTCPNGGGVGGTIVIPLGTVTYNVPANNTDWLPTGDQNSILSWMGAVRTPDLCNGHPMDNAKGAVFTANVVQNPASGTVADFRFKYRNPAAKGKTDTNCTDPLAPKRNDAATCGASWSQTVRDP